MNLKEMLAIQKEFDEEVLRRKRIKKFPAEKVGLAYRVELGELAQEWKQFKFWKDNKGEIDYSKLKEEFADCVAFALSLTNYRYSNSKYGFEITKVTQEEINDFYNPSTVFSLFEICFNTANIFKLLKLGCKLGMNLEEIEQEYKKKMKINWERLNSGY